MFDKALKGDGHIAQEFIDDKNLEAAIHSEMEKVAFLLDPRLRIGLLTAKDVATGYAKKWAVTHPTPPILIRQTGGVGPPERASSLQEKDK